MALSLALNTPATLAANAGLQVWSTPYLKTSIEAAIWYPTDAAEQKLEAGPFSHRVAAQAPVNAGSHPMVLISHGTGGN